MFLDTTFSGRILQVTEALDYGDAVSNQVINIDSMLRDLGFDAAIHSKWHHEKVREFRSDLETMQPSEDDIVIVHFSGYSEYSFPYVKDLRCTKICIYHNITPHTFFNPESSLYEFCLKGRQQLREVVTNCHYFWGDSAYNLQELIDLGADPEKCAVVPIVVARNPAPLAETVMRERGAWLFLGRVAANKGHLKLVKLFADVHKTNPESARKLYIVGGFDPADPYYQEVSHEIQHLGVSDLIVITGKVPDAEVERYLAQSSIYVSMSEHEGFGVPLIEAANHGLPVVALRNTAIGETLGGGAGLAESPNEMHQQIRRLLTGDESYYHVLQAQKKNAIRFTRDAVNSHLIDALRLVLPDRSRFTTVSIVICTYNRAELLDRCLDYLQHQTNQNFEVIVINGPSTDDTESVLSKYNDRIKIGRNPERNLSVSRNMGIELSDGDLIAFIDDDALPFDDWVETLIREFARRPLTLGAIGGPVYLAGTLEFQAQDIAINKFADTKVNIDSSEIGKDGWERSLLGTNTCFRSDVVRDVMGFDEQFDYFLDESELCFRIRSKNHIVGYCPDLYLRHEFAQSHNREGKHKFNWYTICKNTAYFIGAYSGLQGKALRSHIEKRMEREPGLWLKSGRDSGEISQSDYDDFLNSIQRGIDQGLVDLDSFPRTRALAASPGSFQPYSCAPAHPLVGRDTKRLHVCMLTKEFPPFAGNGGIGTLYYHLASELLLMGHHVTIVVPSADNGLYRRGRFSVRYTKYHDICSDSLGSAGFTNNANWAISAFHSISDLHKEQPIDILESALWDSEALALSLLDRDQRPPLVVRLVTPFPVAARMNGWTVADREAGLFKAAEQALLERADAIVPISQSISDTIEDEYGVRRDARWISSHCGIAYWPFFDSKLGYAELGELNGKPLAVGKQSKLVLFIGRLESRKGVDILLKAANNFLASDPDAHLLLAGRDIENWTARAQSMLSQKIVDRVHFLGQVDDATRDKLLHAAYCVVFPSRYESFGLVPLEAFVHGVPVVASRAGAIPEVVHDEHCGLLFEPANEISLADCVERILLEPQLRERLSDGARTQIRNFSSRKSAVRAVKLYSKILSGRDRRLRALEARGLSQPQ